MTESSFETAKKRAHTINDSINHTSTFYCGCTIDTGDMSIDRTGCGTEFSSYENREIHIEWEHVVPASRLGKGRECYDHRERADIAYGVIDGELLGFGDCDFEKMTKLVEPREQVRGDIASIYYYMAVVHGIVLGDKEKRIYDT